MTADSAKKSRPVELAAEGGGQIGRDEVFLQIEKLWEVQYKLEKVFEETDVKLFELKQKYKEMSKPLYVKRNEIISYIPDFWFTALKGHAALAIWKEDREIFKYLESLNVEDFKDIRDGYCITFKFKPNPFFEDMELTKTINFRDKWITGPIIKWKEGKGPADGISEGEKGNKRPLSKPSFFDWFDGRRTYLYKDEVAEFIRYYVWPHPIKYYNNEDFEDDSEEDEGLEETEADRAKKSRTYSEEGDDQFGCDEDEVLLHMEKLQEVQNKLEKVFEESDEKVFEVMHKCDEMNKPLFEKRNEIIISIPDFWFTTFRGHSTLANLLTEEDREIFRYLESLNMEYILKGYRFTFKFKPNPFFENTELTKTIDVRDEWVTGPTITWKEGKGPDINERDKGIDQRSKKSFFTWFEDPDILLDEDEVPATIKLDIWPNPIRYFIEEYDEKHPQQNEAPAASDADSSAAPTDDHTMREEFLGRQQRIHRTEVGPNLLPASSSASQIAAAPPTTGVSIEAFEKQQRVIEEMQRDIQQQAINQVKLLDLLGKMMDLIPKVYPGAVLPDVSPSPQPQATPASGDPSSSSVAQPDGNDAGDTR